MPPRTVKSLTVGLFSDGDSTHRPSGILYQQIDPQVYLQRLASKWMAEYRGGALPGVSYTFDQLPDGYALYQRPRVKTPNHFDKYLFGHPSHQVFDSANRFFPHFCHLMLHQAGDLCLCELCGGKGKELGPKGPMARFIRAAPPFGKGPTDEEGSPLPLSFLLGLLRKEGRIDRKIEENQSMDWRANRALALEILTLADAQPSFVPRVGEMVLWCADKGKEIRQEFSSAQYKYVDPATKAFTSHPDWMGGIVTQAPLMKRAIEFKDILGASNKQYSLNYCGFRIEWYHGPNANERHVSKRYSYVPMNRIRPMGFWKELTFGMLERNLHFTVRNCLTAMSTFSPIERYRFKGQWPSASVYANGCYLGAESIFAGDIVRLSPEGGGYAADVLKVTDIVLNFDDLESSADSPPSLSACEYITLTFHGYGFTLDRKRSITGRIIDGIDLPGPMRNYNLPWFYITTASDPIKVDYTRVIGRLYEGKAMEKWGPKFRSTMIDMGREGVQQARRYASQKDSRLAGAGNSIYFSDNRAEALNLDTFNGIDVGARDPNRDPKLWRSVLAVVDGVRDKIGVQASAASRALEDAEPGNTFGFSLISKRNSGMTTIVDPDAQDVGGSGDARSGDVRVDDDDMDKRGDWRMEDDGDMNETEEEESDSQDDI